MNKVKQFGYIDALKYIGNKWMTELQQHKYAVILVIFSAYVNRASGEDNDEKENIVNDDSIADRLVLGLIQCNNDLFSSRQISFEKSKIISTQAELIKLMNKAFKHFCGIIGHYIDTSDDTYTQFCDAINNKTIDSLVEMHGKIVESNHYEL